MTFHYVWELLLSKLEEDENVKEMDFLCWIVPLMFQSEDDDTIYLVATASLYRKWFFNHYLEKVNALMDKYCQKRKKIVILTEGDAIPTEGSAIPEGYGQMPLLGFPAEKVVRVFSRPDFVGLYAKRPKKPKARKAKRRLGTWIKDLHESGEAFYILQLMAKGLTSDGQPLAPKFAFLYANQGLGKTHMMNEVAAIAWEHGKSVVFVSADKFIGDFMHCVRPFDNAKVKAFETRYRRSADLLIIDGIENLEGNKEKTLLELVNILNARDEFVDPKSKGRQLYTIITSTKEPKALRGIPGHLMSRFQGGYIGVIKEHSLTSRIKVVKQKARDQHFELPDNVAAFMARNIHDTLRQLQGALICLMARASFDHCLDLSTLDDDRLREILGSYLDTTTKVVTAEMIKELVCDCGQFEVSVSDLRLRSREHRITLPRQVAAFLMSEHTDMSSSGIARALSHDGNGDHSTIISSRQKIARLLAGGARTDLEKKQEPIVKAAVETVRRKLPSTEDVQT